MRKVKKTLWKSNKMKTKKMRRRRKKLTTKAIRQRNTWKKLHFLVLNQEFLMSYSVLNFDHKILYRDCLIP